MTKNVISDYKTQDLGESELRLCLVMANGNKSHLVHGCKFKESAGLYLSLTKTPSFLFNINPGIFKRSLIVKVQNRNGDLSVSFRRRG